MPVNISRSEGIFFKRRLKTYNTLYNCTLSRLKRVHYLVGLVQVKLQTLVFIDREEIANLLHECPIRKQILGLCLRSGVNDINWLGIFEEMFVLQ